jgi:type I restriction enzyme, S subunit
MPQDMQDGRISCDRIARVDNDHIQRLGRHKLQEGDVVFSRRGDVTRFAIVTDREAGWLCGTGCIRIRLNSPDLFIGYVRRYLQQRSIGKWLEHHAKGQTMLNLNTQIVRALPFLYPPVLQQRRIAEVLDQAEASRGNRRTTLAQLEILAQAIFSEMFGDPCTNPMNWEVSSLGALVEELRYGTSNRSDFLGKPTLRIPNVLRGLIDTTELKLVPVVDEEFRRLRLRDGDLLFVRTNGNPDYVGRCAVFEQGAVRSTAYAPSEFIYASYLIRARLLPGKIIPVFLREYLSGNGGRRQLRSRSKTSAGQYNLNTRGLGDIRIPVPPIWLQQEFACRMAAVEQLKSAQRKSLDMLDELFASLQHRAFRGEL